MKALLDVADLTTGFETSAGWTNVLHGVSFSVGAGEIVGIVGESGSGKSTAIRSILGLLPSTGRVVHGSATLEGIDLIECGREPLRSIRGRRIGFIAQNPFSALNPVLRLSAQFRSLYKAHGVNFGRAERAHCLSLLAQTGIHDPERVMNGYAFELSGGMAQRVVIALALALEPTLVIADEPTTALDLTVQRQVLDVFATLTMESGRSALIVSHDLSVVANYCDRVVVMLNGDIVEQGDVAEILENPQHPYTRALMRSVRPRKLSVEELTNVVR